MQHSIKHRSVIAGHAIVSGSSLSALGMEVLLIQIWYLSIIINQEIERACGDIRN